MIFKLNVAVEWIAFLFRIRKVSRSNFGPETGYAEGFRGFTELLQVNTGMVPYVRSRLLPSTPFTVNCSPIILSFDIKYSKLLTAFPIKP
jgi:hypothetical protein